MCWSRTHVPFNEILNSCWYAIECSHLNVDKLVAVTVSSGKEQRFMIQRQNSHLTLTDVTKHVEISTDGQIESITFLKISHDTWLLLTTWIYMYIYIFIYIYILIYLFSLQFRPIIGEFAYDIHKRDIEMIWFVAVFRTPDMHNAYCVRIGFLIWSEIVLIDFPKIDHVICHFCFSKECWIMYHTLWCDHRLWRWLWD